MALVTIPRRNKLLSQMVSSIPVLGPALDAIVARRKSNKKSKRRPVVVMAAATNKSRRRRKRVGGHAMTGGSSRGISVPENRLIVNSNPIQINMGAGSSTWKFAGKPQAHVDFDADRGVRLIGGSLGASVTTTTSGNVGLFSNNSYKVMGVFEFDPRLASIGKCFNNYAIREFRVTYVPALGSGGSGGIGNSAAQQLFFGILENVDIITEVTTPQMVLELDPSMMVQSTGTQSMFYEHRGTQTWSVDISNSADNRDLYQFVLMALSGSTSSASGQTYGSLYYNYVIDLYCPSIAQSNIGSHGSTFRPVPPALSFDSSDVKDEKSEPVVPRSLSIPVLKRSIGFQTDPAPPSPTKSLLAAELRDLRSKHFAKPLPTCATS